jgi:hypothetical protein
MCTEFLASSWGWGGTVHFIILDIDEKSQFTGK